jgi:pimeloyl-ACP methyl ester carboxylesterase
LTGHLFLPESSSSLSSSSAPPPVIVLANGLGLSQDCSLDAFVDAFTRAGFAAFTFDYATFGASQGLPRHQVKPQNHVQDLRAALRTIRQDDSWKPLGVDASRIGLWGTSLGGGHVLCASALEDEGDSDSVKAVVAQVPHIKAAAESLLGTLRRDPIPTTIGLVKVTGALLKWSLSSLVFWDKTTTYYLRLHGLPGSSAMMQNPGDDVGYAALIPTQARTHWRNAATVASVLAVLVYRPMSVVSNITAPALLIAAEHDTLCPAKDAQQAAARMPNAEWLLLEGVGHFDVYQGHVLEQLLVATVDFFQKHL